MFESGEARPGAGTAMRAAISHHFVLIFQQEMRLPGAVTGETKLNLPQQRVITESQPIATGGSMQNQLVHKPMSTRKRTLFYGNSVILNF